LREEKKEKRAKPARQKKGYGEALHKKETRGSHIEVLKTSIELGRGGKQIREKWIAIGGRLCKKSTGGVRNGVAREGAYFPREADVSCAKEAYNEK